MSTTINQTCNKCNTQFNAYDNCVVISETSISTICPNCKEKIIVTASDNTNVSNIIKILLNLR